MVSTMKEYLQYLLFYFHFIKSDDCNIEFIKETLSFANEKKNQLLRKKFFRIPVVRISESMVEVRPLYIRNVVV